MTAPYTKIVATGGIGTGLFYVSYSNETMGRNESRPVMLSPAKDYCKQQIVLYYAAMLTAGTSDVLPIGCVGDDAHGGRIIEELRAMGMETRYVNKNAEDPTAVSICLQYPDKDGFNFTPDNSALRHVTPGYIECCVGEIGLNEHTIVAAIPEVSVEARLALLRAGKSAGCFNVLTIPAAEAEAFVEHGALELCGLLALNGEETEALARALGAGAGTESAADILYERIASHNPEIMLLSTMGKEGAVTWHLGRCERVPPMRVQAVNTTGAGDACLGGTIAGLALGLAFQKGVSDAAFGQSALASAVELGTLCAAMAVEDEDSIAYSVHKESVAQRIAREGWTFPALPFG